MITQGNRTPISYATCNTCTISLVAVAYRRAFWFRFVREPLKLGMLALAWFHRIDARDYPVRTESCYGCLRFVKTALKEKSPAFRLLNGRVNPIFDRIMESIVSLEEVRDAKTFAREATHPKED